MSERVNSRRNWLPASIQGKIDMATCWLGILPERAVAWGIPEDVVSELDSLLDFAIATHSMALLPNAGTADRQARNRRVDELAAYMRFIKAHYLLMPPLVVEDFPKLGLRVRDTTQTPSPVPATVPEIEVNTSVIRRLNMRLRDHGAVRWGKPAYVRSMDLAWGIREKRPAHIGDLANRENGTANPFVLTFEEEDRGKRVFFSARWLNNISQSGPWSDIESAIIP